MSRKTRKLIWSVPLIAAVAVIGALALFLTLEPNDAAAQGTNVPGMPPNLAATTDGPTRIELTWDEPDTGGEAIGYRIDTSEDGMTWELLEVSHPDPRYVHEGLLAREKHYYRVFAFNADGASLVAGPLSAITAASTKPDAPTNLSLERGIPPQEVIVLTWEAPDEEDGAPVTDYRIQRSKTGGRWSNLEAKIAIAKLTPTSDGFTYDDDGLDDDGLREHETWYYRVYAINSEGEGEASNAPKLATMDSFVPGPPQNLFAGINPESPTMWLYWDEPNTDPDDGGIATPGAPINGYLVQGRPGNGTIYEDWSADASENILVQVGETTDFEITNRELGKVSADFNDDNKKDKITQWQFRVYAVNTVVERTLDDPTLAADELAVEEPPLFNETANITVNRGELSPNNLNLMTPPKDLDADPDTTENSGRTRVDLDWKAPTTLQRDAITGDVEQEGSPPTDIVIANATTLYRVEVSTDRIEWTVPTDADWTTINENGTTNISEAAVVEGSTQGQHGMRVAGTTYYYRVFAKQTINPLGTGVNEASFTWASRPVARVNTAPALQPQPPTGLAADTIGHNQIDLVWTPPGDTGSDVVGNGKIVNYLIEISSDGSSWSDLATIKPKEDRIYTFDGTKVSDRAGGATGEINFEHTKLMPGVAIHYRVRTINNAPANQRESRPSESVIGMTEQASEPDAPGGLVVQADGRTMIKLCWNEQSAETAAAPTSGYRIDISDDDGTTWSTLEADTDSTDTVYTDSGLRADMTRHYRVYAINSVGTSPGFTGFDDGIDLTNDNDAMAMTDDATVPGAPMVTATADSDTAVTVGWTAPTDNGGATITGYMVESAYMMADGTMSDWMAVDPAHTGMAMTYMDTGLMPETMYYYQVRAMNAAGNGEWSDGMASAMTMATGTDLTPPSGVVVSSLRDTVSVTWDPASIENADQVKVVLFDSGVTKIVYLETFNAANDPDAATFTDVDSGTYKVTVASFRTGDRHKLSALMEVTVE